MSSVADFVEVNGVSVDYRVVRSSCTVFSYIVEVVFRDLSVEAFNLWCRRIDPLVCEVGIGDGMYRLHVLTDELRVADEVARTAVHELCLVIE